MKRALLLSLISLIFAACGGDDDDNANGNDDQLVETLPGCEASVCEGNYVRSCTEDMKQYVYTPCSGQMCGNGVCKAAGCLEPEKTVCLSAGTYEMCLPSMAFTTQQDCPEDTQCSAGECVPTDCDNGDLACGWLTLLTCEGGAWKATECAASQYCDRDNHACQDMDPFCVENPLGARCKSLETALHCQANGAAGEVDCNADDVCVGGFCQPRVAGVTYEPIHTDFDVVSQPDAPVVEDIFAPEIEETVTIDLPPPKDIPPLEKKPKAEVTITGGEFAGEKVEFTASKTANYVFKDKDLQVSMAKGMYMMEVHFQGIEEGVVGNFSSDEPGSVTVSVTFNDGTTDQELVQWKYVSVSYNATLDQFDPPGGRVVADFSAVLERHPDSGEGPPLELTDGFFDVPRKE